MKLIYVFIVLVSTPFVILSRGYQSQIIKNQQARENARRQQILQDYKKTPDYQNNIRNQRSLRDRFGIETNPSQTSRNLK